MSVRVRYAPSPTGHQHIGGIRTCLYDYLLARATGGKVILRIEDTDQERSKREFEDSFMEDFEWLGLSFDEGPQAGGDYGPYRQSDRLDIYKEHAQQLIDKDMAYYDFCTTEEIEAMNEKALAEGRDPHYEGPWKDPGMKEEALKRIAAGESAAIRFRAPKKEYTFKDAVRGDVRFPDNMVGDFVILRATGLPTYNYCCVVDDALMKISHVIRGDEHLNNTVRQLMLYEAFGWDVPQFMHVSLLVGHDRQKLSKRHGVTSVSHYREQHWLPEALKNYLCLLGWSHPEEKDIFNVNDLGELFDPKRFSKSPALYDMEKLAYVNGQHIKQMDVEEIFKRVSGVFSETSEYHKQNDEWKKEFLSLFQEKIHNFSELPAMLDAIFSENVEMTDTLKDILSWETTPEIQKYVSDQLGSFSGDFVDQDTFKSWMDHLKKEMKIKGKPLFMGMRGALTGHDHGPDLSRLIPLTPAAILKKRVEKLMA